MRFLAFHWRLDRAFELGAVIYVVKRERDFVRMELAGRELLGLRIGTWGLSGEMEGQTEGIVSDRGLVGQVGVDLLGQRTSLSSNPSVSKPESKLEIFASASPTSVETCRMSACIAGIVTSLTVDKLFLRLSMSDFIATRSGFNELERKFDTWG